MGVLTRAATKKLEEASLQTAPSLQSLPSQSSLSSIESSNSSLSSLSSLTASDSSGSFSSESEAESAGPLTPSGSQYNIAQYTHKILLKSNIAGTWSSHPDGLWSRLTCVEESMSEEDQHRRYLRDESRDAQTFLKQFALLQDMARAHEHTLVAAPLSFDASSDRIDSDMQEEGEVSEHLLASALTATPSFVFDRPSIESEATMRPEPEKLFPPPPGNHLLASDVPGYYSAPDFGVPGPSNHAAYPGPSYASSSRDRAPPFHAGQDLGSSGQPREAYALGPAPSQIIQPDGRTIKGRVHQGQPYPYSGTPLVAQDTVLNLF